MCVCVCVVGEQGPLPGEVRWNVRLVQALDWDNLERKPQALTCWVTLGMLPSLSQMENEEGHS